MYPILFASFFLFFKSVNVFNSVSLHLVTTKILAYILSPKVKIIDKNSGEQGQIRGLFFKKVIDNKV
jgi:hypothetical protein